MNMRRAIAATAVMAVLGLLWVGAASQLVIRGAQGRTWSDVSTIPSRNFGLVLGCSRFLGEKISLPS